MFDITLAQGYGFLTMLAVAAAAMGLVGVFYWRAFGMLRRDRWIGLLVLRTIAILIVVLLFFRPVFSYYKDVEQRPSLVFLLDINPSQWFDKNDISHFLMAGGIIFFYLAAKGLHNEKSA